MLYCWGLGFRVISYVHAYVYVCVHDLKPHADEMKIVRPFTYS